MVTDFGSTGGTRTYALELLRFYRRNGASVTLIASKSGADSELADVVDSLGVELVVAGDSEFGTPSDMSRLQSLTEIATGRRTRREALSITASTEYRHFDIVVVSTGHPGSLMGALHMGFKSLYIVHTYPHGWKNRLMGRLFSRQLPTDATVLTVSKFSREELVRSWRLRGRPSQPEVIYSTAGPTFAGWIRPDSLQLTVLTVGHVESYKEPFTWIDMAARVLAHERFSSVRFEWVGEGSLLEASRKRVSQMGFENAISFVGARSDVTGYYEKADVYVQLSSVESLGLAVLDACRFGIPSVVTRAGGLPEIVQDDMTGRIVRIGHPEEAALAVKTLLLQADRRNALGRAARARYEELFAPSTWIDSMTQLHNRMLSENVK
jgi:glycosyltransferase involved in cell wall biosynthesis